MNQQVDQIHEEISKVGIEKALVNAIERVNLIEAAIFAPKIKTLRPKGVPKSDGNKFYDVPGMSASISIERENAVVFFSHNIPLRHSDSSTKKGKEGVVWVISRLVHSDPMGEEVVIESSVDVKGVGNLDTPNVAYSTSSSSVQAVWAKGKHNVRLQVGLKHPINPAVWTSKWTDRLLEIVNGKAWFAPTLTIVLNDPEGEIQEV